MKISSCLIIKSRLSMVKSLPGRINLIYVTLEVVLAIESAQVIEIWVMGLRRITLFVIKK